MNDKYIPLYRKYRPQKLDELIGQEHIKNALTNAIELNKISHAYLFTGPRGTGKTSTARIFAKSLNCKNGPTISPCGVCESCMDIANSVPIDVIEIDAASNRKVEDTQNILEKILYAPVYGRYKIYIIDEVHMLSNTAFNSLLKTLEEPPENVIFILATTEVHKVLDTIKSRCQRFDFRRITIDSMVKHLRYIADNEKINISDDALVTIAKNSAGGMRDSIALLDQVSILSGKDAISSDDINRLLGRISFDVLNKLADYILTSDPQGALEMLENIYNSGNEPVQIFSNLLDYLKNLLIVKNCNRDIAYELVGLNEIQVKALQLQCEKVETLQIMSLLDKCAEYIKEIKLTNNPRLWLEVGIIDLANLTENTKLEDIQRRLQQLEASNDNAISAHIVPKLYNNIAEKQEIPTKQNSDNDTVVKPAAVNNDKLPKAPANSQDIRQDSAESSQPHAPSGENVVEEFAPMPKSQSVDKSNDISELWATLLSKVSSLPTKSLLKQWANPVELSSDKVVITISSGNLLKQFTEGNKRKILSDAVMEVFNHSNLLVRLPQPNDKVLRDSAVLEKPKEVLPVKSVEKPKTEIYTEEEIIEAKEAADLEKNHSGEEFSMHSDTVNMVKDLFDGKFLD